MVSYRLIDTHAHLDFKDYEEILDEIIGNAKDVGVDRIIIPGVTLHDIPKIIEIIEKYDDIYGAVAVHPSEAKSWADEYYDQLKNYASHEKIVAIGETGLDYYWDKSFIDIQKHAFRQHLKLAQELKLPVIVHDREAHTDVLSILREFPEVKGVMHCFSGDVDFALECIEIGYYIAVGGAVTFKNAKELKFVAEKVPLEWLVLETDAPFLAPHPFRGKLNEPAKVRFVAEEIARIKGISPKEVANVTSKNADKLFFNI
ncbi:MAG: hydrolase TatD [Candidatus Melainabacteria bacterium GWF2_37_15]|nr:MAG: hydrolase TatD [Candidatus Melainabacteria bacterium GWF2_37_15]